MSPSARRVSCALLISVCTSAGGASPELPAGYWTAEQTRPLLRQTLTVRLAPDISGLSDAEREALDHLLAAGRILHDVYLQQNHHEALSARERLLALDATLGSPQQTRDLLTLFDAARGPIATTLANERLPFLPVDPERPGRTLYPPELGRAELDAYLAKHPDMRATLLDGRTVVRDATEKNLARDLRVLTENPVLDVLHPGLRARLARYRGASDALEFYAVPYSVAWADELLEVHGLLWRAAAAVAETDPDFADYLRNRGRDLISDDYEAGNAAWVRGRFNGRLNAQIGAFETYDDELYGVKAFFATSLLMRRPRNDGAVSRARTHMPAIENALPYKAHKTVHSDIPLDAYDVIADFGQARSANTATILPNDPSHARKYGRIILLRDNILRHPRLVALNRAQFNAALAPRFHPDFTATGNSVRTLWHEIGHYLGADRTSDGRSLDVLAPYDDLFEEMKSDLVALFAAHWLHDDRHYDLPTLRGVQASGVRRVLQLVMPRREQPYQTMQLIQWNWFLENGLLTFDPDSGLLAIDHARYAPVVTALLTEVLALQTGGDAGRAAAFVERWAYWSDDLHEIIAAKLRASVSHRYRHMQYAILE